MPQRFLRDVASLPDASHGKEIGFRFLCHCVVYDLYDVDDGLGAGTYTFSAFHVLDSGLSTGIGVIASLDASTNTAAPLPTGNEAEPAPAAAGEPASAPPASTEEATAEPASSFEIVQVLGRHVPIPRSKPARQ